jgi:hypothetical protein
MAPWSQEQRAIIVGIMLKAGGFFDHVVTMWSATDHSEAMVYVEHALTSDAALRTKIATEVVNERGELGGPFEKNKRSIGERNDDVLMVRLLMDGFVSMTVKRAQYPGIAFGSAWDQRKQNSEMVLMEDLLARLGEHA